MKKWPRLFASKDDEKIKAEIRSDYPQSFFDIFVIGYYSVYDSSKDVQSELDMRRYFERAYNTYWRFVIELQKVKQKQWVEDRLSEIETCKDIELLKALKFQLENKFKRVNHSHDLDDGLKYHILSYHHSGRFFMDENSIIFEDRNIYEAFDSRIIEIESTLSRSNNAPSEVDMEAKGRLKRANHKFVMLKYLGVLDYLQEEHPHLIDEMTLAKLLVNFIDADVNTLYKYLTDIVGDKKSKVLTHNARKSVMNIFEELGIEPAKTSKN